MALRKRLLGGQLRRLRLDRKITQTAMAERLGISASYLNLIEHDQRPVTVGLLLKLGEELDVDLRDLSDERERRLASALREVFADPELRGASVSAEDIQQMIAAVPAASETVLALYRAWRIARDDAASVNIALPSGRKQRLTLPTEEARDFFETYRNHFPALESRAEALWTDAALSFEDMDRALERRLSETHGVTVEIAAADAMGRGRRHFDPSSRTLALSEVLTRRARRFHMAYHLAFCEAREAMDDIIGGQDFRARETETLCRIGLGNYYAGAVLMPYPGFVAAARATRYDLDLLMRRFDASLEQAAHRLSTLQRPGDSGIPFFFARADIAGNITKRFSASGFQFSRFGGACARFVLHDVFTSPGRFRTQIARLSDGARFFCFARTVETVGAGYHAPLALRAICLGCDIDRARDIVYADGLALDQPEAATDVGPGCRLCDRTDCGQRAFPPLHHRLVVDEAQKGPSAYEFNPRS